MITVHRDQAGNVVPPPPPPPPQNMYPTLNGIEADPASFQDGGDDRGEDDIFHEVQEDGAAGGQEVAARNPPQDAVPTAPHFATPPQPHWIEMACKAGDLKGVKAEDLVEHAARLGIPGMIKKVTKREVAEAAVKAHYLANPRQ